MTFLIIFFTSLGGSILGISCLRAENPHQKFIIQFLYYALLFFSFIILFSELFGLIWPDLIQVAAFVFVFCFILLRISIATFWGKIWYHFWLVILSILGGYLYSANQIPYPERPYSDVTDNQPKPLDINSLEKVYISGLPINQSFEPVRKHKALNPTSAAKMANRNRKAQKISWNELDLIMSGDSHVRSVLHQLKEQQKQALSTFLSELNSKSVNDTRMRRHALDKRKINDLLNEKAISLTRYKTIIETWKLLDSEENAYREKQAEQRFHMLLELLEDEKVDESKKIELIDFVLRHFADDVRLIKPLINLYHHLDDEYPRQKRLNRNFLDLYIAKRNAILRGFKRIGLPVLQPLLDYRNKTLSTIRYSQARLDLFVNQSFHQQVSNLYEQAKPVSIPEILNREKYPPIRRFRGASFKQDYIRRELVKIATENASPVSGEPLMELSNERYTEIRHSLLKGYHDKLDYMMIDKDPAVRGNLAWLLAELKAPYTLPLILELMRDFDPDVRRLAAIASGNFKIKDMQGANDPKFIEIIRMMQNYRSNSDAFGRIWALMALSNGGDKQKALYIIDLILNDGKSSHSILGAFSPTWRSKEEQIIVHSLIDTLKQTPEELSVKTGALNALIALDSPESLGILLHYLQNIYQKHDERPSLWRYIIPHMTLPQEAENVEDLIFYNATTFKEAGDFSNKRHLKALNMYLRLAYEANKSGQFFQNLTFLRTFDANEYQDYLKVNKEQIRILRLLEYTMAGHRFWLVFIPLSMLMMLFFMYGVLPKLNLNLGSQVGQMPNRRSNPAADKRNKTMPPPSSIIPIKIISTQNSSIG
jgi:hypothetical protein